MLPKPIKDDFKKTITASVEANVAVPMRDGTKLYADVYPPAGGGSVPVLLHRLPYWKTHASIPGPVSRPRQGHQPRATPW